MSDAEVSKPDTVNVAAVFVSEVEELGMQFADSSLEADCPSGVGV